MCLRGTNGDNYIASTQFLCSCYVFSALKCLPDHGYELNIYISGYSIYFKLATQYFQVCTFFV